MTDPEIVRLRLVAEMEALPDYRGWMFTYEYPGYFCYSHDDLPYSVLFTPDHVLAVVERDLSVGPFQREVPHLATARA